MEKKGQVTIFIIAGILLVSSIALFFLFKSGIVPEIGGKAEQNPNSFLESCLEDKIRETVEIISLQGGYMENSLNIYFKFEDEKVPRNISYLCYNQNDYVLCIPQKPMLIPHLEEEIHNNIFEEVRSCFDDLTSSLERSGYDVDAVYRGFEVDLIESEVDVGIDAEIILTKTGETTTQEDFKIVISSKLYELSKMVNEIVNKEATVGEFSHYHFLLYPEFDIIKYRTADSSIVYSVKHRESSEMFRFAVRGGVMPPGFGLGK